MPSNHKRSCMIATTHSPAHIAQRTRDPHWVRVSLTVLALAILGILVVIPVVAVFVDALERGVGAYWANLTEPTTVHSMLLTLVVAPAAVFCNTIFGVAAAWAVTRFRFRGRAML